MSGTDDRDVTNQIRKFQASLAGRSPDQVFERLMAMLQAKAGFERCCLITFCGSDLYLEGIIRGSESYQAIGEFLANRMDLPQSLFLQLKSKPRQITLDRQNLEEPLSGAAPHYRSLLIQPVGNEPAAFLYAESTMPLPELQRHVAALHSTLQFCELVLDQALYCRHLLYEDAHSNEMIESLWRNQSYLNSILRNSPALISVKDLEGKMLLVSESCGLLEVVGDGNIRGKTVHELYCKEAAARMAGADSEVLETGREVETQTQLMHKDGTHHSYWLVKFPLTDRRGDMIGVCTIANDITERLAAETLLRERESRLAFVSFHDDLTGLPNRALFYDRIEHSIARCRRSSNSIAVILLDIDRFKLINDSLNHEAGDHVLKEVARRLVSNVRDMDTVARLGGDEFVVVLEGVQDNEDVSHLANKILVDVSRPISIQGHEISTSVSMGVVVHPQDGEGVEVLLKNAELAMYKAKESGKNRFQYFTEDMNASAVKSLMLENELRRAIDQDQLSLYYQPQFELGSNQLSGLEALVRWRHPQRGLISPLHFIPLAEETGLIVALGDWVLRHACTQAKTWLDQGKFDKKIAVNLSPRQFRQNDFTQRLAQILRETRLPPEHLELEITESCAMENPHQTIDMMKEINAMGVSLAIDDFGTGYSSLAYLKQFPIRKLKIDRSFVKDITTDNNDAAIAQSIISLAHNMSLLVIAEGVEDAEQAEWLSQRHCDMVQGYFYAKPMSGYRLSSHLVKGRYLHQDNVIRLGSNTQVHTLGTFKGS